MHSSLGVTLLVYVEQYSGRNYSSLSVRNWTMKKERSITKTWKNIRIVESEKCFRIETEAAVYTTCCSRWSRWFPGRSRKSAWVEIYRIRAVLDSHSFDSLFRVHEKSVSRRRHRVYAALSLHYIIPLCSRARNKRSKDARDWWFVWSLPAVSINSRSNFLFKVSSIFIPCACWIYRYYYYYYYY